MTIIPIILAGGFGTRLWPISRQKTPKQFTRFVGDKTLFQQTVSRIYPLSDIADPIIICNYHHYSLASQQLSELNINNAQTILEPVGRGTAPAIAIAAFKAQAQAQDPILLVLPSDHFISDLSQFRSYVTVAKKYAQENLLVCFGITPKYPEVGYGYIRMGKKLANSEIFEVAKFVEKPNILLAKQYVDSKEYCWNSGIFMFSASAYLDELKQHAIDIYQTCYEISANKNFSSDNIWYLDEQKFSVCPNDSIDYAVMEKTTSAVVMPLDLGWSDLGSWQALWDFNEKNSDGNVIYGNATIVNTTNSYIHTTTDRKVCVFGIDNCVIVETADAILVVSKDRCSDLKIVLDKIDK